MAYGTLKKLADVSEHSRDYLLGLAEEGRIPLINRGEGQYPRHIVPCFKTTLGRLERSVRPPVLKKVEKLELLDFAEVLAELGISRYTLNRILKFREAKNLFFKLYGTNHVLAERTKVEEFKKRYLEVCLLRLRVCGARKQVSPEDLAKEFNVDQHNDMAIFYWGIIKEFYEGVEGLTPIEQERVRIRLRKKLEKNSCSLEDVANLLGITRQGRYDALELKPVLFSGKGYIMFGDLGKALQCFERKQLLRRKKVDDTLDTKVKACQEYEALKRVYPGRKAAVIEVLADRYGINVPGFRGWLKEVKASIK